MTHPIDLKTIIKTSETLLSLPDICFQLKRIVDDPDSSADDLAKLIVKDPALTARLLKLVNSAIYYFPRQVSSLKHAITLVGTQQLYILALATSATAIIRSVEDVQIELETLWKHSVYSAVIAEKIATQKGLDKESLFVAGLLGNIGTLAVVKYDPEITLKAITPKESNQLPWQREEEVLGFTMAEAGASLLDAWGLPDEIIAPIRYHHSPMYAKAFLKSSCALNIATRMASGILKEEQSQEHNFLEIIDEYALTMLEISEEELVSIQAQAEEIGPEMLNIFTS
ncbi:MAG: HDOD domain-containing protein [Desulfobulbaceae bacterium]|nr:HDOD domain-containing protein [Desulfobulbaceae bacterium]